MYADYLNKLVQCISGTQLFHADGTIYTDYEEIIGRLVGLFTEVKKESRQVFFVGNGGSAAIASHMTADFMKNGGMKTYSLYDTAVTTCMGNDYGYEYIFSRPLEFLADKGDLLVAISSSGNSQDIVNVIEAANKKEMKVLTLSGFQRENRIRGMGDYNLYVPVCRYGIVESIHNLILQHIVDVIQERDGECL